MTDRDLKVSNALIAASGANLQFYLVLTMLGQKHKDDANIQAALSEAQKMLTEQIKAVEDLVRG